jgi:pimeloyl-ACP methyl ester carboxylesterase
VPAAVVLLVAACGSEPASRSREDAIRSTATAVPFTGCGKVACTGTLGGAQVRDRDATHLERHAAAVLPRLPPGQPAPPDFAPVQTDAQDAPTDAVATALLAKGYALAGSAYCQQRLGRRRRRHRRRAAARLLRQKVGQPDRTYVWGESLGGLVTEMLAEKHPDWIAGAAPLCGVLGGTNLNFDLADGPGPTG